MKSYVFTNLPKNTMLILLLVSVGKNKIIDPISTIVMMIIAFL